MNTKTEGISSGLVAVAEVGSGFSIRWTEPDYGGSCKPYDMLVRLSDAEAIIAQKDAEILDQCRLNGMGAEREAALLGQIERQSAALKLARAALTLNRIRAEGMRMASTFISLVRNDWASAGDNLSVQAAEYLISALDTRADELEKTNG